MTTDFDREMYTLLQELGLEIVIGIETHITVTSTQSKLFCHCRNTHNSLPNTDICPVCTGQMGVLPLPNKAVVVEAKKLSQALQGNIASILSFDRKHYSYPDLPKGYQITQLQHPISTGGSIHFLRKDGTQGEVEISHFHIEEDPAKLIRHNNKILIDYNRSGRPLFEVVTKPVIHSIDDAISYMMQLQKIVRFLGISDADMEKGYFKSDVSISLRKKGTNDLNPRTEIKNMNSFAFALEALKQEITSQIETRKTTNSPKQTQETKGWNEATNSLVVMREKENIADYKFMNEPDIPEVRLENIIDLENGIDIDLLPHTIEKKLHDAGVHYDEIMFFSDDVRRANILFELSEDHDVAKTAKSLINIGGTARYDGTLSKDSVIDIVSQYMKNPAIELGMVKVIIGQLTTDPTWNYQTYMTENTTLSHDMLNSIDEYMKLVGDNKNPGSIVGKLVSERIVPQTFSRYVLIEHVSSVLGIQSPQSKSSENKERKESLGNHVDYTYDYAVFADEYRTHLHSQIDESLVGQQVVISGWVHSMRDHGSLVFIDLRAQGEVIQIQCDRAGFDGIENIVQRHAECNIRVTGVVTKRLDIDINPRSRTGTIEVVASRVDLLAGSQLTPFEIASSHKVQESKRMTHRYLDLRNPLVQDNIIMRHKVTAYMRNYFDSHGFIHVDTPILGKPSDEGSREFYVPSRLHAHSFYTLPQAPQQLKQILMGSGVDKYYQVARCFRDEDPKGDRQPEFTQIDLEMAYVKQEDIMNLVGNLVTGLIATLYPQKKLLHGKTIPVYNYDYIMERYSIDKPDMRYGLPMATVTDVVRNCGFKVFADVVARGGVVKCMKVEGGKNMMSKKYLDVTLREFSQQHGGSGLANFHVGGEANFVEEKLGKDVVDAIVNMVDAQPGDTLLFAADTEEVVHKVLSQTRAKIADDNALYNKDDISLLWVVNFPMFEKTEEGRWKFTHNPFSMPSIDDLDKLLDNKSIETIVAQQYDIVMNGSEIGGGSIRAHLPHILAATYKVMGYTQEETEKSVGHMIEAFTYGFPPHGGLALGLDRILMILQGHSTIREVIPFPKTGDGKDLLMQSPSGLSNEVIKDVHIKLD